MLLKVAPCVWRIHLTYYFNIFRTEQDAQHRLIQFLWQNKFVFLFRFHWSLFLSDQLPIRQCKCRPELAPCQYMKQCWTRFLQPSYGVTWPQKDIDKKQNCIFVNGFRRWKQTVIFVNFSCSVLKPIPLSITSLCSKFNRNQWLFMRN